MTAPNAPAGSLAIQLAFVFGLTFFLGFTFEDIYQRAGLQRPGGVRTFPLLGLAGGMLYLLDPARLIPFTAGLVIVGAWLTMYYRERLNVPDVQGQQDVGLTVLLLNVYAYVLGAAALALPLWVSVGTTVTAVLLFAGRERLHELARRVEINELVTLAQFLILTGLVLPLLPDRPITSLTAITPRQAWLALVVVSGLSYASYLVQRYVAPATGTLWTAALGGLYSSTATTVVFARQVKADAATARQAQAGITIATGIMYVRILAVVAIFNITLAGRLALPLITLAVLALLIAALQYRLGRTQGTAAEHAVVHPNPLELGPAVAFAAMFIVVSVLSAWVEDHFGIKGIYGLAAIVGVTDVDPFVLNLAQGGASGLSTGVLAAAILIAASSNNLLKAGYAAFFAGWRSVRSSVAALLLLSLAGLAIAWIAARV